MNHKTYSMLSNTQGIKESTFRSSSKSNKEQIFKENPLEQSILEN